MTDSLSAIIDSPDGSFELGADPSVSRRQRRWSVITSVAMLAAGGALVAFTAIYAPGGPLIIAVGLLVIILAFAALGWLTTASPTLKADADEVSYMAPFRDQRLLRTELASIMRGEVWFQGRRSIWLKSYLFMARDGTIAIRVLASWYSAEAMTAFASRLGVPMRGDFTDRYRADADVKRA